MTHTTAGAVDIPPELLLVLATSLLLWKREHGALHRLAAWCCFSRGAFRVTRVLAGFLAMLPLSARMRSSLWRMQLRAHEALGETDKAVEGARRLAAHARAKGCSSCAHCAAGIFIHAGLYHEAIEVERGWQALPSAEAPSAPGWALVRLTLIEAIYHLGDWGAALACLDSLEETARRSPSLWNDFLVQRAWLLAHTGDGASALAALERVDGRLLPRPARSELLFIRAAALLALHRYDEAERETLAGMGLALRASSTRNGLFLLGRITQEAGRLEEALHFFEAGAAHPSYKGQGGDALLAWGDCLKKLGRYEEALHAWRLVLERDRQSSAAWEACSRLGRTSSRALFVNVQRMVH